LIESLIPPCGDRSLSEAVDYLRLLRRQERTHSDLDTADLFVTHISVLCSFAAKTFYIFIDGIDESPEHEEICAQLIKLGNSPQVHRILVCSRPEIEIKNYFKYQPTLELTEDLNAGDLQIHVDHMLHTDAKLCRLEKAEKTDIKRALLEARR
jgi:hypothetical protein